MMEQCKPKMFVAYTWITIVFLLFVYSICAIALAVENDSGDEADNEAIGFAGIFTMLLSVALAIGGTMVMRKYQTELAVGFFLGVVVMMAFNFLTLTALLAYEYNECDDANHRVEDGTANCYFEGCNKVVVPPAECYEANPPNTCFDDPHFRCCNAFQPISPPDGAAAGDILGPDTLFTFAQVDGCAECSTGNCDANLAGAVFACFLFIAYAIFAFVLGAFKAEIVAKPSTEGEEDAKEPPAMQ